jgi:hypothetical protein
MNNFHAHENTTAETFKELDEIFLDKINSIKNNKEKVDSELFQKILRIHLWFENNTTILINDIVSVDDAKVVSDGLKGIELFSTAIFIECKVLLKGRKRRVTVRINLFWYILATSKLLTLNSVSKLYSELDDFSFYKSMGIMGYQREIWKSKFMSILALNDNIRSEDNKEIELWLKLQ